MNEIDLAESEAQQIAGKLRKLTILTLLFIAAGAGGLIAFHDSWSDLVIFGVLIAFGVGMQCYGFTAIKRFREATERLHALRSP